MNKGIQNCPICGSKIVYVYNQKNGQSGMTCSNENCWIHGILFFKDIDEQYAMISNIEYYNKKEISNE